MIGQIKILSIFNFLKLQFFKIYHLLMLWLSSEHKWLNMNELINKNLLSDRETLLFLKKNPKVGIIRNGNSELGLMVGNSPKTQEYNKALRDRLVNNCKNYNSTTIKNYLLALPLDSLFSSYKKKRGIPDWYPGGAASLAMRFLVKQNQLYASPYCFRIIEVLDENMDDYLKLLESLFNGRDVIYIGPLQGKNPDIPAFLKPKEIIKIPEKNAFEKFDEILKEITNRSKNYKNPLVVIVGGTTASALSYELNMSNITCYDFGQFNRLYHKFLITK